MTPLTRPGDFPRPPRAPKTNGLRRGFMVGILAVAASGASYNLGRTVGLPMGNVGDGAVAQAATAPDSPEPTPLLATPAVATPSPTPTPTPVTPTPAPATPAPAPATPAPKPAATPAPARLAVATTNYVNRYTYGTCTYYAAARRHVPPLWGNANAWYSSAQRSGWAVGSVARPGAIAWTNAGYYGHVAIVEQVSGSSIYLSEMNFNGNWNKVTYRWASAASFLYIY